jgi:hypothetical protein
MNAAGVDSLGLVDAIFELDDLQSQMESLRNDSPDATESDSLVGAPLKPPPHLNSGAIALPQPEDPSF